MSLRSVNLNLLPVLQALLRERNLSRAGAAVGLTQPAVSAALAKLRGGGGSSASAPANVTAVGGDT